MRLLVACSLCLFYVLNSAHFFAYAAINNISVKELLIEIVERNIHIDCEVEYGVDKKVKSALRNGIEVTFALELQLQLDHEIWLDTTVTSLVREFRLKYHALSKQYVLKDVEKGHERSFPDLYSAFFYMGNMRELMLANIDVLELDQKYYVRARARLLTEKLPLPLRVKSYFSQDWRPSSGWTIWPM